MYMLSIAMIVIIMTIGAACAFNDVESITKEVFRNEWYTEC